jgi:threonine dehydrogenase-like Zn-dependent dehydrogenase
MKAVVWHGEADIRLDTVDDPVIRDPQDAIVHITRSAICGTDLHFVRGTMAGMKEGTVLGHEAVGVVRETGAQVRGFTPGDRVIVCSTISCGVCGFCRAGNTAQCDMANPNGPQAGTSFFGGPATTVPVDGLQAEYARIPEVINFDQEDPVQSLKEATRGRGVDAVIDPSSFITQHVPVDDVIGAYESFDRREEGWIKTVLNVG